MPRFNRVKRGKGFLVPPVTLTIPTIGGTLGGTITGTAATFTGATTIISRWLVDGIEVGTNNQTTLDSSLYPGRSITYRTSGANSLATIYEISTAVSFGVENLVYSTDFSDPASGSKLLTVAPYNFTVETHAGSLGANDPSNYTATGGVMKAISRWNLSGYNFGVAVKDAGTANHTVAYTLTTSGWPLAPVFAKVDANNFLYLTYQGDAGGSIYLNLYKVVGGTSSLVDTSRWVIPSGTNYKVEVRVSNGAFGLFVNGTQYVKQGGSATTPLTGNTMQAFPAGFPTTGTKSGLASSVASNVTIDDFYQASLDFPFAIVSVSDTEQPATYEGRRVTLTGTYTGTAPTGIDLAFSGPKGEPYKTRFSTANPTISGGTWSVTALLPELGNAVDGKTITALAWAAGAASAFGRGKSFVATTYNVSTSIVAGQLPPLPLRQLGINEVTMGAQTANSDWARDLFYSGHWAVDIFDTNCTQDGKPRKYPTSSSTLTFALPGNCSADRAGTYVVNYTPTSFVPTLRSGSSWSVTQAASGGVMKLSRPAGDRGGSDSFLDFTGQPESAFSTNGLGLSIRKDGDTAAGMWQDEAVSNISSASSVWRPMDVLNTNNLANLTPTPILAGGIINRRDASYYWTGGAYNRWLSIPACISICKQANQHFWLNGGHTDLESYTRLVAKTIAESDLPLDRAIYAECSNEWTFNFAQNRQARYWGIFYGFGTLNYNSPSPEPTLAWNSTGGGINVSNVLQWDVPVGGKIMICYGPGYQVWRALTTGRNAGTTILDSDAVNQTQGYTSSDGNWQLVYNNTTTLAAAMMYMSKQSRELWYYTDDELTKAGRPRSVHTVSHLAVQSLGGGLIHARGIMEAGNLWQITDRVCVGPYAGPDYGNYLYDDASIPWTATQKDLAGTDITAFKSAYMVMMHKAIDNAIAVYAARIADVKAYNAEKGLTPFQIRANIYEFNMHDLLSNHPSGIQAATQQAQRELRLTQGFADEIERYTRAITALGGEALYFARIYRMPVTYPGNQFGMAGGEGDNSLRFQSLVHTKSAISG